MNEQKTYVDEKGYRRFVDSGNFVHRWVAETYVIHRRLRPGEVVHHIDGNKQNNSPENLEVMDWTEHNDLHEEISPGWHERHGIPEYSSGCGCVMACLGAIFLATYFVTQLSFWD